MSWGGAKIFYFVYGSASYKMATFAHDIFNH